MRNSSKLFSILFVFFQSCATTGNDCEDYTCFTPPSPFLFEIVDSSTGENLITNGTFQPDEIKITTLENDKQIIYEFLDEMEGNLIRIHSIGWVTEITTVSVDIGSKHIFELYLDAESISEDCCSFIRYNEVRIDNAEYELNEGKGIYRIFVE